MNSSLADLDAAAEYYFYNDTNGSYPYPAKTILFYYDFGTIFFLTIISTICCIGFVGNGYIVWLLGFQIKRNPFTTLVLNLAVADFGFLLVIFIYSINLVSQVINNYIFQFIWAFTYQIMYINSHFLLAAISIDRCASVLFPIWHHCSRPRYLSPVVCALLWIFSFLLGGIMHLMQLMGFAGDDHWFRLHFLVTAVLCFPLITVSTVILFIKIGLKSQQKNQGQLLLMILITLLCYLMLAFPLNFLQVIVWFFGFTPTSTWQVLILLLCSCLNSSINPVIYFLVGRRKQAQSKEGLKAILQKVFKEGEATGGR